MGRFPAHRLAPGDKELADVRRSTGQERQKRLGPSLYEIIVHRRASLVGGTQKRDFVSSLGLSIVVISCNIGLCSVPTEEEWTGGRERQRRRSLHSDTSANE